VSRRLSPALRSPRISSFNGSVIFFAIGATSFSS
jgi:hypothetical protein